jgi:membrane-associated phospholipid phosphatase
VPTWAWALSDTVKELTRRPDPRAAQAIGHWTGYAFPSGHTTKATAVYGMLAAATSSRARKVAIWTAALLVAGLVGLTRLCLSATG